jgi:hypothetical protein
LVLTTLSALQPWPEASSVSASPIDGLTKPDYKHAAKRFIRWRKNSRHAR